MPTDKNPIDELILKCKQHQAAMSNASNIEIAQVFIDIIQAHRPAFEAGLRGALRYNYEETEDYLTHEPEYVFFVVDDEGNEKPHPIVEGNRFIIVVTGDVEEGHLAVECFAKSLKLRAEFVED